MPLPIYLDLSQRSTDHQLAHCGQSSLRNGDVAAASGQEARLSIHGTTDSTGLPWACFLWVCGPSGRAAAEHGHILLCRFLLACLSSVFLCFSAACRPHRDTPRFRHLHLYAWPVWHQLLRACSRRWDAVYRVCSDRLLVGEMHSRHLMNKLYDSNFACTLYFSFLNCMSPSAT